MAELDISLDWANLRRFRTLVAANRKIAAQSLTFTAERAQDAWRLENHHVFHMRRPWIDRGVRIKHATPGNLEARVGSIDRYMGRHVKGVDDPKRAEGRSLFVPVIPVEQQGTHTQIRAKVRRMAKTQTKPFIRNRKLMRRVGRAADSPLKVIAVLRQDVDIKPRLDALSLTTRAVNAAFPSVYERLLLKWAAGA